MVDSIGKETRLVLQILVERYGSEHEQVSDIETPSER